MDAGFPLPTERAARERRKEAETGNRGPVIEAICFSKDMLLRAKYKVR